MGAGWIVPLKSGFGSQSLTPFFPLQNLVCIGMGAECSPYPACINPRPLCKSLSHLNGLHSVASVALQVTQSRLVVLRVLTNRNFNNIMKTSNVKKIKSFARLTQSKLVAALNTLSTDYDSDRQNILTELMLIDIETNYYTADDNDKRNENCFFRTTNAGGYVIAAKRGKGKPQLATVAKDRLNKATKNAYSINDFRRCYDFIKAQSKWDIAGAVFVVDYDAVNSSMRSGAVWPNFNKKPSKKESGDSINGDGNKPEVAKAIVGMSGIVAPELTVATATKPPKFKAPVKAAAYYTPIIKLLMSEVRKGGMKITVELDGKKIVLVGDES